MKLIQLTNTKRNSIYINIDMIGHIYSHTELNKGYGVSIPITKIGVTTHNNGGFEVLETVEQIIRKIENANAGLTESKINFAKKIKKINQKSKIKSNETS
jgi:hypothetical protein